MTKPQHSPARALKALFDHHVAPSELLDVPEWPAVSRKVRRRRRGRRASAAVLVVFVGAGAVILGLREPRFSATAFAPHADEFPPVTAEFETLARFVEALDHEEGRR